MNKRVFLLSSLFCGLIVGFSGGLFCTDPAPKLTEEQIAELIEENKQAKERAEKAQQDHQQVMSNMTDQFNESEKKRKKDRDFRYRAPSSDEIGYKMALSWLPEVGENGEAINQDLTDHVYRVIGAGAAGGIIKAVNTTVETMMGDVLKGAYDWIKNKLKGIQRIMLHKNGSIELVHSDISRWKNTVDNMLKGLSSIAETAKGGAHLKKITGFLVANEEQRAGARSESGEEEASVYKYVDEGWRENANIFLSRINYLINEIEVRKLYYKENDEIVHCLDMFIIALVGKPKFVVDPETNTKQKVWSGGIYSRINNAESLGDLGDARTEGELKLFHQHINGLLAELGDWVSARTGKPNSVGGRSSGSSYGGSSYNGF